MDGSSAGLYGRGEVVYLLSLSHADAIDDDVAQPDSVAMLAKDTELAPTTHVEWDPIFTIARWHDVQRARRAVENRIADTRRELDAQIVDLRAQGLTEEEVAAEVGLHRLAARRRFKAQLDDILAELGGEQQPDERLDHTASCMACGLRPRARRRAATRKRRGKPPITVRAAGQASVCYACASDQVRESLIPPPSARSAAA